MGRVFANGRRDLGSIPGRVIPKTLKIVLDASWLNIQQCKVSIKGKVEQSKERSSALSYTSVSFLVAFDYDCQLYLYIYIYICKNVFGISFFRKDSMKVNMDKIRQYEGSRKKYNPNR